MTDRAEVASPVRRRRSKGDPHVYDVLERPFAAYASLIVIGGLAALGLLLDGRPAYVVLAIACMACGLPRAVFGEHGFVDPGTPRGFRTIVILGALYYVFLLGAALVIGASSASPVAITLLGAVPLAAVAGIAVLTRPDRHRLALLARARPLGPAPPDGMWGSIEGTTATEAGAVAGVAVAFASGEHVATSNVIYNGERRVDYTRDVIWKHASELVVELGDGATRRVKTVDARWCSTVRVKQTFLGRTTTATLVHAQTRIRIAGAARGGELVASGGDSLLVFGSLLPPAEAIARLRWREWAANGAVVLGISGLVALNLVLG